MLKLDDAIAGSQMVSNNDDDDVYDNEDDDEAAAADDDTNDICNPHISVNHIAVKILDCSQSPIFPTSPGCARSYKQRWRQFNRSVRVSKNPTEK